MKLKCISGLVFALMLVAVSSAHAQQSAGVLLQSGLYKEQVNGDLEAAIDIYERVLKEFPEDRPVAAEALLHIGLCYEKLGKQEAQKAYQRLIKEFADQIEPVRVARQHLEQLDTGAPGTKGSGPTYRLVLDEKIAGMPVGSRDFSPSGDRIAFLSENKLYIADQTATVIRPLLDDLGPWEGVDWPSWSPDGRLIAYRLSRGLPPDSGAQKVMAIFVVSPDGGAPRQIGPEVRKGIQGPFWTPDSRHLSYRTNDGLHTLTLDGNEVRLIPEKDLLGVYGWDCGYSPNGRWVVSTRGKENGPGNDLCIFPAAGGTVQRIINLSGGNHFPTWAPDGRTLYFVSATEDGTNIWKLPMDPEAGLAKGQPEQVTFFKNTLIRFPRIIGDGSQIAFRMSRQTTSIQVADASSPHEARSLARSGKYSPELSPDGQTVYYVNDRPGEEGIHAVPRQGGTPRRLTESLPVKGYRHSPLDLSPDGRTLAYVAELGNGRGLYTLPTSGGEPRLLVKFASVGDGAQWSPDGSSLAYAAGKILYVIPGTGGESREVAQLGLEWEGFSVRWSPDGKYIAGLGYNKDTAANRIFVVPASGGKVRQLTPDVEYPRSPYKQRLEWHPDGKRLTYHISHYNSETRQVYLDGRPPSLLVDAPGVWDYEGTWAPDGVQFFFVAHAGSEQWGIYVYNEASGKTTLVDPVGNDVGVPCFSRDGKTMAWYATRSTSLQTWVMENFLPEINSKSITARQVWAPTLDDYAPSPDGRYISCINWTKGNLAVHDIKTGEDRDLTDEGTWEGASQYCDVSIWSPDSRQVAYCWYKGEGNELRIVDLNGSKPRVLCGSVPEGGHAPLPYSWSQDGKYILALLGKKDESLERGHEDHIVLVSVADGSLRILKSLGNRRSQFMSLSPDGRHVVFELTTEDSEKRDIYLLATDGSGEATLVEHPADDWAPFWAPDGKRIVFVSDRMGSADLWLLDVDDGKPKGIPTLVKEMGSHSRPKGFTPDGSFYYGVMTPAYDVYVATLDFEAGKVLAPPTKMSLRFEGWNYAPFWSPDGKYLAYAHRGRMSILIRSVETGQERELSTEIRRFLTPVGWAAPRWSPDGASILLTGGDGKGNPCIYLVDVHTGDFTLIGQDEQEKEGDKSVARVVWPVFSNDGKRIYGVRGRSIVTYNLETHRERELYRANTYILRLALSPNGQQLAFFEAAQALRPTVVKTMPASGGEASELYTLKEGKRFSWGVGLSWTPDGDHVVVGAPDAPDKPDELWSIPATGGEPRKLNLGVKVNHVSLHPDGRRIAFTRPEPGGSGGGGVWVMENFLPEQTTGE